MEASSWRIDGFPLQLSRKGLPRKAHLEHIEQTTKQVELCHGTSMDDKSTDSNNTNSSNKQLAKLRDIANESINK